MPDLTDWLLSLRPEDLADVLSRRPDVLVPPVPRTMSELAERLNHPHSVAAAVFGQPLPVIQVAEAVQALGDGCDVAQLAAAVGRASDDAEVHHALAKLRQHALVWPDGALLRTEALGAVWSHPMGIGATAADLLADRRLSELRQIALTLGVEPARRRTDLVRDIASWFADGAAVARLAGTAPPNARELLREAAWHGPFVEAPEPGYDPDCDVDPVRWAVDRALLVGGYWDSVLQMPSEVILALRGPDYRFPFDPAPPGIAVVEVDPEAVERESAAAATAAVGHVAALLRECARQPVALLKAGGVGTRELRRLARSIGATEPHARFWLELCRVSDLVAVGRGQVAPTAAYDGWRTAAPGEQLATLLAGWRGLSTAPLHPPPVGQPARVALTFSPEGSLVADLRERLLVTAAAIPDGAGFGRADDAGSLVAWRYPMLVNAVTWGRSTGAALWREAELLGVAARGAVTRLGRACAGDCSGLVVEVARELLPAAETSAVFQADLTVVVGGTPAAGLADLLDSAADRETRDAATVWRFSSASVRRALDAGTTGDALLAALREAAVGEVLPQPLEYLVKDVARRHGELRVREVRCCLRTDDPAVLDEILVTRSLASLGLTRLAPTVLASGRPVTETLEALRSAGYAPVAETADANPLVDRVPAHRAPAARRRPRPDPTPAQPHPDPAELAAALLAAGRGEAVPGGDAVGRDPARTDVLAEISRVAVQLTSTEQRLLSYAVSEGVPVRIDYTNADGNRSSRVIEDVTLEGHMILAWCTLRQDERMFALSRIGSVSVA